MISKEITTIKVADARGTSISVELFLHNDDPLIAGYARELAIIWDDYYGGKPDVVAVNGDGDRVRGVAPTVRRRMPREFSVNDILAYECAGCWWSQWCFGEWLTDLASKILVARAHRKFRRYQEFKGAQNSQVRA